MTDTWTVGRLLGWTTDYLNQHGAESARLDAELLLGRARKCSRIELYTAWDEQVDDDVRTEFRELVKRRAAGTPVAYLLGFREFFSLRFRVTPDVLIPRPETEHLVVALLELARGRTAGAQPVRVVDVGTGSGVIAICAAKHLPGCMVTAVDTSAAALAVAEDNARRLGVHESITFVQSDLLEAVTDPDSFDFVVSNPPYVGRDEVDELATEVRDHEPRAALIGGERGSELIARLVPQACRRLCPGGHFLCEIAPRLDAEVRQLVSAQADFEVQPTIKDLAGLPRVVRARRRG
ncbi:MAG: peptide chain release factor N(5)-glutamine methyltransferase [Planctomycetales bacterium]|nr:peptide chain release factor N(5)-glutamine methyltransferase [Planctomycetales bacterium]